VGNSGAPRCLRSTVGGHQNMNKRFQSRALRWLLQILYLISAICIITTISSFLGGLYWAFEFASYFIPQVSFILLLISLLLLCMQQFRDAAVCMGFSVAGLLFIVPLYTTTKTNAVCEIEQRILMINLQSINQEYWLVEEYVRTWDPDVAIFEEVTPEWDVELKDLSDQFPIWSSEPRSSHTGIAVLSKVPDLEADILTLVNDSTPNVVANYRLDDEDVLLIGIHPHPPFGLLTGNRPGANLNG
jgi:endonuclease/exonuclease/phosphatase (EEP) superfamily protein YafD